MVKHSVTTETCFVSGDHEVPTGNIGEYTRWDEGTRIEAKRIADGLDGIVVEETPEPLKEVGWDDGEPERITKLLGRLKLAIVVGGGQVVARVYATERL